MSEKHVWKLTTPSEVQLSGPYQCSSCNGQVMLDRAFVEVLETSWCPFCGIEISEISEETAEVKKSPIADMMETQVKAEWQV